jgi:hypothetical protein
MPPKQIAGVVGELAEGEELGSNILHRPDAAGIIPGSSPGQAAGVDEGLEDGAELLGLDAHDPGAGVVFERLNPDMPGAVQ